ncbi:MAG: ferrochelatase [Puniceicoccales bacterium]|nr:ferrochelatase [Puniceicoccales bacterium]
MGNSPQKRGVLLLNLGSPKSCAVADVRAFLREFLGDPCVLDMPAPLRWLLLYGVILRKRPAFSAEAYKRVWTPQGSPLLATTEVLREALEAALTEKHGRDFAGAPAVRVYAGMRYGEPSTAAAIAAMAHDGVTDALVLPQYPHYAMSSYGTAVACAREAFRRLAPQIHVRVAEPFYNAPGYIAALVESARPWLEKGSFDKLLFSCHGIPLRHLRREIPSYPDCTEEQDCCPPDAASRARDYRHQCFATMEAFAAAAGLPREKCAISFQSRLGKAVWIRPYTDATLRELPARGVKRLLVICPAFTADCLETLDEIRTEGRKTFMDAGGEFFEQIPCLNAHPAYVRYLAEQTEAPAA